MISTEIKKFDSIPYVKKNKIKETRIKYHDSLKVGVEFYNLTDFEGYKYIEIDTYENFLVDNNNNMYNIIIYEKNDYNYAIIAVLEKNIGVGELSPIWKKTKKYVSSVIIYPKDYKPCWNYSFTNEDINCCLFVVFNTKKINLNKEQGLTDKNRASMISQKAFKVWEIDEKTNQFIEKNIEEHLNIECY
ncbi:hypothetical protein [uncultured Algibacter sp.]|uniref:hypothetical protein n=1 Tax=uncultured Algibacter sp. TaxID=298659 RepID=UPI0032167D0D